MALWGVESFYGKNLGNFIIINSLASLSFDGRRKKFFLNQLKNSLEIIEKNNFSIKDYRDLGPVLSVRHNLCQVHF